MTGYAGDFSFGHTLIPLPFPTHKGDGTPITLAGTPTVTVYKDNTTTKSTSGVTLTVDLDGVTGSHAVKIDTSADAAFYAAGHDFVAKLSAGTVDSISVVGYIVGSFSIENRSGLRPTVAGRTLDVASTGEAGVDLTNKLDTVGILPAAQAGAASGLAIVGSTMALAATPPTKEEISTKVWSETARALTDKTGFALSQAFPTNFASLIISALGKVTVGTNDDKSGYALTSALSAQNVWEYATRSLSTAPPTKEQIRAEMDANSTQLENIHADIANIATLGGAIAKTYTVYESDGVTPMAGCLVWATSDLAGASEIANRGLTDDLGHHIFYFDVPACTTVYIWRRKSLKSFTNPDIEVV